MKDIKVFILSNESLTKNDINSLIYDFQNNRQNYYSGIEVCDKIFKYIFDDKTSPYVRITDTQMKVYNRLTKELRKAFVHIVVGKGRATRHYYHKIYADEWLKENLTADIFLITE